LFVHICAVISLLIVIAATYRMNKIKDGRIINTRAAH
jgi:hypothetical protein